MWTADSYASCTLDNDVGLLFAWTPRESGMERDNAHTLPVYTRSEHERIALVSLITLFLCVECHTSFNAVQFTSSG